MEPLQNIHQPTPLIRFCGGIAGAAILFAIPFLLYGVSLGYPLLFLDDGIYFVRNPLLAEGRLEGAWKVWTGIHYGYTPITHLSIWLDVFLREHGINGWWLARFQQLVWVSIGILGVRRVMLLITGCPVTAWCIALLFALHPICSSTVLWLALRRQALCFAFSMWALVYYLEALKASGVRQYFALCVGVLVFSALACLSRFNAASLFLMAPLLGVLIRGPVWKRTKMLHVALALPIITTISILFLWRDPNSLTTYRLGNSIFGTFWLDGEIIFRYFYHIIFPWKLAAYYGVTETSGISWRQGVYWLIVISTVIGSMLLARKRREIVVLWLIVIAALGPTLNVVTQVIGMADHYVQPAMPFILLILWRLGGQGWEALKNHGNQHWPMAAFLLTCLYLGLAAWPRNLQFSSSVAFSVQSVKCSPQSGLMLSYGVNALREAGGAASVGLIEELSRRALTASDLRRCNDESYFQLIRTVIVADISAGAFDEAHALLTKHGTTLLPPALFILRANIMDAEGDGKRAVSLLKRISPITEDLVERIWVSRKGGYHLPIISVSSIDGPGQDIYDIPNPLAVGASDSVWEGRVLCSLALLLLESSKDYPAAARYALALVSINPQMVYGWEILESAYIAMKQNDRAAAARARRVILTSDIDAARDLR